MKTAKTAAERPAGLRYIESSALVAALVDGDEAAHTSIDADGVCVTSELTLAEARRTITRRRVGRAISPEREREVHLLIDAFEQQCDVIRVTSSILARVGRLFPSEPVRPLDAIHLASIESLDEDPHHVIVVTRDTRIEANARAMGYVVE